MQGAQTPAHLFNQAANLSSRSTIIGIPIEPNHTLKSLLLDGAESVPPPEGDMGRRLFKIRTANSSGMRSSANILIHRMYASRGYQSTALPDEPSADRITLMASDAEVVIGTITIGFDSGGGLLVDELFHAEIAGLRRQGFALCEFTKLAMDSVVRSKRVLASLFHVAYIYAHRVRGFDFLLIEVNPRHVHYYEKMFGFVVMGPQRLNLRVNAPAVLMSLDFKHAHRQISQFGGKPELSANERSLYPYSFSESEEAGIFSRLQGR
jgi:hypothetical protein